MTERLFYTSDELAPMLGVKPRRTRQLLQAGIIPHVKRGTTYLIPRQAFASWIMEQNTEALRNAHQVKEDRRSEQ